MPQKQHYEMKDSGVEWIGEIPKGWEDTHLKNIFLSRDGGNWGDEPQHNENDCICLRIADFNFSEGRFKDTPCEQLTMRNYSSHHIQKLSLRQGDLLIEKSGGGEKTPVGRGVLFDKSYKALYANFMERLRINPCLVTPEFVEYFWRSMYYMSAVIPYIKQTTGIQNLDLSSLLETEKILIPTLTEQNAIALYLNKKCAAIDEVMTEMKATVEDYKKWKSSLIFETVTKGLDKNAEMKDSGVRWIGDIPKVWETKAAKYCVEIHHGSDPLTEGDVPVYGSGADSFKTCGEYKEGPAVLVGRKGATLHIPHYITGKYWNVDTAFDVSALSDFSLKFYYYLAICFDYKFYISQTTLPGMTQTNYKNMTIPVPSLPEQEAIVSYLDGKCTAIDGIIAEKEALIAELESYKKSLIFETVTGKRKVC